MAEQARRNHPRVVDDDHIVRTRICSELLETRINPRLLAAIDHEHPRSVSLFEGRLRDQLSRKLVIKISDPHLCVFIRGWMFVMEDGGELCAEQQNQTRNVAPCQNRYDRADRSVNLIVVKVMKTQGEDVLRHFPQEPPEKRCRLR